MKRHKSTHVLKLKNLVKGTSCKQTNSKNVYTTHNVMYHGEAPSGDFTCPKCQKKFLQVKVFCGKSARKKNPWTNTYYCTFPGKNANCASYFSVEINF